MLGIQRLGVLTQDGLEPLDRGNNAALVQVNLKKKRKKISKKENVDACNTFQSEKGIGNYFPLVW